MRVHGALGVVENLHGGNEGGVSHVGGIGGVGVGSISGEDAASAVKDVGDARPGVPFGGERARMLVGMTGHSLD